MMHLHNQNDNHGNFLDFFIDKKRLEAGFAWDPVIQQNLKCAHGYFFLVSVDSLNSPYIKTNELPAMAFEHEFKHCPIYLFLVSECEFENYPVKIDSSDNTLILGSLEGVGPKKENGRWVWFNQLKPEQREKALSEAAKTIFESMQTLNIHKPAECDNEIENAQNIRVRAPQKLLSKPRADHLIAHLNRNQISDSLMAELESNVVVAVATNVIESDWVEGIALRYGYEKLPVVGDQVTQPVRFDVEWPLLSSKQDVREKALWQELFKKYTISTTGEIDQAFTALWSELVKLLHKKIRVVVHYKLRVSKSDLSKDKPLALQLADRWKSFLGTINRPLHGRIILLFSINQDTQQPQGLLSWFSKKAIDLETLIECLEKELPVEQVISSDTKSCCVIDGGALSKIVDGDTERWKKKIKAADIDEMHSEAIFFAVEENIPEGGIRHRNLMKKVKRQDAVRKLFKVS